MTPLVQLRDVTADNWRACADLRVANDQDAFVSAALSYSPDNAVARGLYRSLGFVETGEREDDEIVARLSFAGA